MNDAEALAPLIARNYDNSLNFDTLVKKDIADKASLKGCMADLFSGDCDTALLYFAGYGCLNELGGYIVTPDAKKYDEGVSMDDVLKLANKSKCKNRIVILDCCHSGAMGSIPDIEKSNAYPKEDLTILTACRNDESAREIHGHGVFTNLLVAVKIRPAQSLLLRSQPIRSIIGPGTTLRS